MRCVPAAEASGGSGTDPITAPVPPHLPPAALSHVPVSGPGGTVWDVPPVGQEFPRPPPGAAPAGAAHRALLVRDLARVVTSHHGDRGLRVWVTLGLACTRSCP